MLRVTVPANIVLSIPDINLTIPKDPNFKQKLTEAILKFEVALNEINYVETDRKVSFRVHITDIPKEII